MDISGYINNIVLGATNIDKGRKYLAADGLEHAGRLSYEDGISVTLDTFKNVQVSADPHAMKKQFLFNGLLI